MKIDANGTCSGILPDGTFLVGLHRPVYTVANLRGQTALASLGHLADGAVVDNRQNYPEGDVPVTQATQIYEIANAFGFRGATYIDRSWADGRAEAQHLFSLPAQEPCSFAECIAGIAPASCGNPEAFAELCRFLPRPVLLALAAASTDSRDLVALAGISCALEMDGGRQNPLGIAHEKGRGGRPRPIIHDEELFETVANNFWLPDSYKRAMLLVPGIQGRSAIVGEWRDCGGAGSHVFEYLRENSYIPWGHYAANMADDAQRYRLVDLGCKDFVALRHLYYQRSYLRLAEECGAGSFPRRRMLATDELEALRQEINVRVGSGAGVLQSDATLWGWNFGYDFAPGAFRLNASHQQIHQQYALVPARCVRQGSADGGCVSYNAGDRITAVVDAYQNRHGVQFFDAMEKAVRGNRRLDGRDDLASSLVVFEDDHVLLFVPKAQTSHMELQLMPLAPVATLLEADTDCRRSLDRAIWIAMRVLDGLGARLITVIELSRRFSVPANGQRLVYDFLPKIPFSPVTFSQTQDRWIVGHYPEDFARACREKIPDIREGDRQTAGA